MSSIRTLAFSASLAALTLGAPSLALAAGEFHPAGGEKGFTEHPSHRVLARDRADVLAERNTAIRQQARSIAPQGEAMDYGLQKQAGSAVSRAEVEREARRAMQADEIPEGNG